MLVSSTSEFPNNAQVLDRKRSNSNAQTYSGVTSPQFSSYGSSPSSQKSFMPLYQRPRGLSIAENDSGNLIQLEMIPNSYNGFNADEYSDLPSLVLKANIGMKKGVKPVLADGAMGGTYFLRDENQKFAVVCKPGDEEPNSPHNPHQTKPGETMWRGCYRGRIVPGFGMYREVAAFLLDAGFAGVPPTQLARVRDYLLRLEAEPFVQSNCITDGFSTTSSVSQNQNKVYEPLHCSSASVYKICSVQSYARHECSAEDMGSSKFHTDDVHRIAALDIRLCNLDRHEGNILVCKSNPYIRVALPAAVSPTSITSSADHNSGETTDDNSSAVPMIFNWDEDTSAHDSNNNNQMSTDKIDVSNEGKYHLVPIDHGYVLPHVLCMNDPSLSWMNWPQSREPLSPSLLRHIASLDYTRDAELLRRVVGAALAETSLLTLQVCNSFLKKGSAAGLTLYEMGSAMCPPDYNHHNQVQTISTTTTNITNQKQQQQPLMSQLQKVVHLAVHNVLLLKSSPRGVNEFYNSPSPSSTSSTDDCTYKSILLKRLHATTAAADSTPQPPPTPAQQFGSTSRKSFPQQTTSNNISASTTTTITATSTTTTLQVEPEIECSSDNSMMMMSMATAEAIVLPELLLPEIRQPSSGAIANTEGLEALNLFDAKDIIIMTEEDGDEGDGEENDNGEVNKQPCHDVSDNNCTETAIMMPLSLSVSPLSHVDLFRNRSQHPPPLPPPLQRTQSHTPRHSPNTTINIGNTTSTSPHKQSHEQSHHHHHQTLNHTVHTTTATAMTATTGQNKPPVVPTASNTFDQNFGSASSSSVIPLNALHVVPVSEEMLKQAMNVKYNHHVSQPQQSSSSSSSSPLTKELDQLLDRLVSELLLSSAAQYL